MTHITLADWECTLNKCTFPLADAGLSSHVSHLYPSLPYLFILAHDVLKELSLHIRPTNQSHLCHGVISLSHIAIRTRSVIPAPSLHTLPIFQREGYGLLRNWGSWTIHPNVPPFFTPNQTNPFPSNTLLNTRWHEIVRWLKISLWNSSASAILHLPWIGTFAATVRSRVLYHLRVLLHL